ncbi:transcriptional regulator [Mergibacter septicus]|uniref:Transcriptional regulator n=1 Tax=Mergibacter septicus TaxID=221402 RepID=A0A8E3MGP6_9PAST|nr:helix-turn-helix transcriptional regulator [Mergibacter septicus]AWX15728.1 transcriptional regulator [Mergibacter septicus]QDJ13205.1 transcriptional regulator [Mergibacter septicus]QDJ14981.1 transcriptional regulator [Mergibacter septicus]UTU47594.1 helix-turn-helix transcriptional regulator [Mergibacter septicus]WMR95223.1 helix-turn-helix transcriptional regulator [Mergibacter septicus]
MKVEQQITQTLGKTIARYRKLAGLTQAEVAEHLGIGIDAVSRMERGSIVINVVRLFELATLFNCDVADLVTESSPRITDQLLYLNKLIKALPLNDRNELIFLIKQLIEWKNNHH